MKKAILTTGVVASAAAALITGKAVLAPDKPVAEPTDTNVVAMNTGVVTIKVAYTNAPPYQDGDYYVWTSEAIANAALNAINATGWFPITGNNARTGKPAPDKAMTTKWANEVLATADGKFVFPRVPTTMMDMFDVPIAERQAWWDGFNPEVEQYDPNWFPVPDEE